MRRGTSGAPSRAIILDPRLAIGLALVAASVAGMWGIVAAIDDTVEVYAAAGALAPGDRIDKADLVVRAVRLGDVGEKYLVPGDFPSDGLVVTRAVGEGELIPATALGAPESVRVTAIVLSVDGQLASAIQPGSTVDVWAASAAENGEFVSPSAIVTAAGVVRLVATDGIVGAGETTAVEILVPRSRVARVLEALANGDAVSVVPASLPVKG